jgi:MiaB/RimO family radical SAM methylthiotransferase
MNKYEEAAQSVIRRDEGRKVLVFTNGCNECRNEAARVEDFFLANGWDIANDFSAASLIVFQGCGVVQLRAEQTLNTVRWLRQQYPDKEILVWGCVSAIDPEGLKQVYDGPTFGPQQMESFNRYAETTRIEEICSNRMIEHVLTRIESGQKTSIQPYAPWGTTMVSESRRAWSIQAATGCLGACTYCRIRQSRGPLCSKPIDQIIAEFHAGLERGYDRFVLLGTDLGCYGMDRDSNLVELLRAIAAIKSDFGVWVRHLNPRYMITYLDELTSELLSRIDILELSGQSGSDDVLAAMNRGYTASDFLHIVSRIRALKPKIAMKSQLMVGFPGETEEDFKRTVDLIRHSSIDFSLVFRYSPAPDSMSKQIGAPLPTNLVNRRTRQLKLLAARRVLAYAARCLLGQRHRLWIVD